MKKLWFITRLYFLCGKKHDANAYFIAVSRSISGCPKEESESKCYLLTRSFNPPKGHCYYIIMNRFPTLICYCLPINHAIHVQVGSLVFSSLAKERVKQTFFPLFFLTLLKELHLNWCFSTTGSAMCF